MELLNQIFSFISDGYYWLNQHGFPVPIILLFLLLWKITGWSSSWIEREIYYRSLIKNFDVWRDGLSSLSRYYDMPGSEHDTSCEKSEHYIHLKKECGIAASEINKLKGEAAIFLSKKTMKTLKQFLRNYDETAEEAMCSRDYIFSMLDHVTNAHTLILKDARSDLSKKRFAETFRWSNKLPTS